MRIFTSYQKLIIPTFLTHSLFFVFFFGFTIYANANTDHCIPFYGIGCEFGDAIDYVELTGESIAIINHTDCGDLGYNDFTHLPAPDLAPGLSYTLQLSTYSPYPYMQEIKAWIDFNNDGFFDYDEEIAATDGMGLLDGVNSFHFTIPENAQAGTYRLRIRMVDNMFFDACDDQGYGETEDYHIEIISLEDCEGMPSAGTPIDASFNVCANNPFTINLSGVSPAASGLEAQWQSSPQGENQWTDISNATSSTLTTSISQPTDFRFSITCTNSNETDVSDVISVGIKPQLECYCIPDFEVGCEWNNTITHVQLQGENQSIDNYTDCSPDAYGDYTDLPAADLAPGGTYPMTITISSYDPNYEQITVWIDFDQSGTFDFGEEIVDTDNQGMGSSGTKTFFVNIPEDAQPGDYRMRVRMSNYSPIDPCTFDYYGEVEDYTISIIELTACDGTPHAGTISQSLYESCAGGEVLIMVENASAPALGLEGQWQWSEPNADVWNDIENANSTLINLENIQNDRDYRFKMTCLNSNESDFSNTVSVTLLEGPECICIPEYDYGCYADDNISAVELMGETIMLSNSTWCGDDGYNDFTDLTPPDLSAGNTYVLGVSTNSYSPEYLELRVWIDYNGNGVFDEDELIITTDGMGMQSQLESYSFTVPNTVNPGIYRMRIRLGDMYDFDACETMMSGEAEDYMVEITSSNTCQETPNAGTPIEDQVEVCANTEFSLAVQGSTQSEEFETFWQYSLTGTGNWVNIPDATDTILVVSEGVNQNVFYRYRVACTLSIDRDFSDVIAVSLLSGEDCYCIPVYSGGCELLDNISNVTLHGESITLQNPVEGDFEFCSENGYGDFTHLPAADLYPGTPYVIAISTQFPTPEIEQIRGWIDFDKNGSFDDEEEIVSTNGQGLDETGSSTFVFQIPENVMPGIYRMRIRMVADWQPTFDACSEESFGETEDYLIEVLELSTCQGTPSAGTLNNNNLDVCLGEEFSLAVTGASEPAQGLTRQWQMAQPGSDNWSDIPLAFTPVFVMDEGIQESYDFRYKVSCAQSNSTQYSDIMSVTIKDFNDCYCTPANNFGDNFYISKVATQGAIQNLDRESGFSDNGYADYTATDTLVVTPGQEIEFVTEFSADDNHIRIWIDYNQNGSFEDAGENVVASNGSVLSPYSHSVIIPDNIEDGMITRLRVRNGKYGTPNSCEIFDYGETEDYIVKILPVNACEGNPQAGTIETDVIEVCEGAPIHLSVSGATDPSVGLVRTWQFAEAGSNEWNDISQSSASTFIYETGITEPTKFRYKVTCTFTNETVHSNELEVNLKPITDCYCIPSNFGCTGNHISNVSINGVTKILNNSSGCSTGTYGDYTHIQGPDLMPGNTYAVSVTLSASTLLWENVIGWIDYNGNGVFEASEEIFNTGGVAPSTHTVSFEFTVPEDAQEGNRRMRIRLVHNGGPDIDPCEEMGNNGETEDYIVEIIEPVECLPPNNLAIGEVTLTTASVSWTAANIETSWEVRYGITGFDPAGVEGNSIIVNDESNAIIENLQDNTGYDVYIKSICGSDNESNYFGPVSFITLCDIAEVPFLQDFENVVIPEIPHCGAEGFISGNHWQTTYLNEYGFDSNVLWSKFIFGENQSSWYFTQGIYLEAGVNYELSYKYGNSSATQGENFDVAFGSAPEITAMTNVLAEHLFAFAGSETNSIFLSVEESGAYYFGFHILSNNHHSNVYLDDIAVNFGPDCLPPSSLSISNISQNGAQASWNAGGDETLWDIAFGEEGFDPNDSEATSLTESTFEFEDLTPNTTYDVYVRSVCGEESMSEWISTSFTTSPSVFAESYYFNNFSYYPNPATDRVKLKSELIMEDVVIYNLLGKEVLRLKPFENEYDIDVKKLPSGIYLMNVKINGVIASFKFIKN